MTSLANNASHIADQRSSVVATVFNGSSSDLSITGTRSTTTGYIPLANILIYPHMRTSINASSSITGIVTVRPYHLRIRIGGYSVGGATSSFRIKILDNRSIVYVDTVTFTDSTGQWRALDYATNAYMINSSTIEGGYIAPIEGSSNFPDGINNTNNLGAHPYYYNVEISATTTGADTDVVLTNLYIAEYVGAY
jgi:hypothetical protein